MGAAARKIRALMGWGRSWGGGERVKMSWKVRDWIERVVARWVWTSGLFSGWFFLLVC